MEIFLGKMPVCAHPRYAPPWGVVMNEVPGVILVGAGGHATSVIDALLSGGRRPAFLLDDDPAKRGRILGEALIRGSLADLSGEELRHYPILVSIAKNPIRQRIVLELTSRGATLCGVRHPSAILSQHATIHPTVQIMAGVIVNAGAVVNAHAVLNTGCIVEHDVQVAEFAHIGPGAVLSGAAVVEEGAFVGSGATLCPFVRLGRASTLGAGAVAVRDVAPQSVAVGIPARPIRNETRR